MRSKTSIFFNDVALAAKEFESAFIESIRRVIASGIFLSGDQSTSLERELSSFFGGGYFTAVGSGHDSLKIALSSLRLHNSDEVILPINSYPTAFPVVEGGYNPVFVDCDENGQISISDLQKKITKKTKAVIQVHLYGLTCDINRVKRVLPSSAVLIEDNAQAFGTTYKDKFAGTLGEIGCFSFYPTKNLGTFGDGGALWTRSKLKSNHFRMARSYGETIRYKSMFPAGHSRLPEIQAAILRIKLKSFKSEMKIKNQIYKMYLAKFKSKNLDHYIRILQSHPDSQPQVHLFTIYAHKRDGLIRFLSQRGIPCHIHYPHIPAELQAFAKFHLKKDHYPQAMDLKKHIISLPFHSHMNEQQIEIIVDTIESFYKLKA